MKSGGSLSIWFFIGVSPWAGGVIAGGPGWSVGRETQA